MHVEFINQLKSFKYRHLFGFKNFELLQSLDFMLLYVHESQLDNYFNYSMQCFEFIC